MILTARVLCLLCCLHDVAACSPGGASDRATSLPHEASFHQARSAPPGCTIRDPRRASHAGRVSDDAANLQDPSEDDSSDDVSLPWPLSAGGTGRQSLTPNAAVTAGGGGSTGRSAVLRC
jgi:hypothetical protein